MPTMNHNLLRWLILALVVAGFANGSCAVAMAAGRQGRTAGK
jgi:hypothetical protein